MGCLPAYVKAQLIFAFVLVRILKIVLGRARPGHGAEFTFFSFAFRYNSFPSGHSADAFVSGVFLYYLLKNSKYSACRFLPLIYAFLIAVSRVFISSHYPSDVAAGMVIGILGAWFFISRLLITYFRQHHLVKPKFRLEIVVRPVQPLSRNCQKERRH